MEIRQLLAQSPYLAINAYPLTNFPQAQDPGRVPAAEIAHPIGSSPSVLTGTVIESFNAPQTYTQLPTLGEVKFNRLVADSGVKRITLNGFVLTDTLTQDGATNINATTGINLRGGVGRLEFQGIDARLPASLNPSPILIQIGSPSTPLTVHPDIRIDTINNTVYDDTAFQFGGSGLIPTGPLTTPSVQLVVNGSIASFDVVSITQTPNPAALSPAIDGTFLAVPTSLIPNDSAALQYQFPIVGTTGRTAIQATSIEHIRASGSVTNTTFSKTTQPFQNSLGGLDSVGSVQVGGVADAVAIDSKGSIKSLKFAKGLGSPVGVSQNPIYYGTPADRYGYPHNGNVGVQVVTEGNIGSITAAPNDRFLQTNQDPKLIQSGLNGTETFAVRPGTAAQSSVIVAAGSIGKTHVVGDLRNTQVSAGTNYYQSIGGVEGVTAGSSKIGPAKIKGDLVDTVIAASYRSNDGIYGNGNDTAGNGTITGTQTGTVFQTPAGTTAAGTRGSGFFSRYTSAHPAPKVKKTSTKK